MAFSSPKKNGNKRAVISEINITPFVDVLLVLLIIFMVAAPMLTSSVDVNLPQGVETANEEKLHTRGNYHSRRDINFFTRRSNKISNFSHAPQGNFG